MILRVVSMSIAVALAACSNSQGSSPVPLDGSGTLLALHPASHQRDAAASEAVIYSFGSKTPDGWGPVTTLTNVRGTFYGETNNNTGVIGGYPHGTIFTVTPSGSETVLHILTFEQGEQLSHLTLGPRPGGGLALYGTGSGKGTADSLGTVVRVTLSGAVIVLHRFDGGADGVGPSAGLINVNGTFYGTTAGGGNGCTKGNCGVVFSVTPSGTENVIYAFHGGTQDGEDPQGGLVNLNGTLYGTTYEGGSANLGTVFSVTPSGTEHVLHSFQGSSSDGADPYGGLIAVNGTLYGTTDVGGSANLGTVFSITPSGTETILHSFTGGADGAKPLATLLELNGKMYGTTVEGGHSDYGTVFSITPSGTERILHAFTGGSDGQYPYGGLINIHTTLYGTTDWGGATGSYGTVYSVTL